MHLNKNEELRYRRQIQLPEIGAEGQIKIKNASVLILGLGGLGSPVALYLTAAGIGHLGIIDGDQIDCSNLQRQILYTTSDEGKYKTTTAEQRLHELNPLIRLTTFNERLTANNAFKIFSMFDFILDGADNFATRYLSNDAAFFTKKVLVSASVLGFEGQLSTFDANKGPCYRCLYPEPPAAGTVPSCAESGVLGAVPGVMGSLQALEVLKLILGLPINTKENLMICNFLDFQFHLLQIKKNPDCPLCGNNATIKEINERHFVCATDLRIKSVLPTELNAWLNQKKINLLDVRDLSEFSEGILKYTHHIPLANLETEYIQIPLETPLVVYCRSGNRSQQACQFLQSKGYNVFNLQGGIQAVFKERRA